MKRLGLLLLLTGCGFDVSGKVDVNHKINLDGLDEYFTEYCQSKYPGAVDWFIDQCVAKEKRSFVDFVGKSYGPSSAN